MGFNKKRNLAATTLFCGLIPLCFQPGCSRAAVEAHSTSDSDAPIRDVRVRLFSNTPRIRLRTQSALEWIKEKSDATQISSSNKWITLSTTSRGAVRIGDDLEAQGSVLISSRDKSPISISLPDGSGWKKVKEYPGAVRIEVNDNGRLRGINEVDIEDYIECVVAWEAWPTFEMAALRAQAIAARTYALDQMIRRNELNHDMSATQGSQVYNGIRNDKAGERARNATKQSRGVVCTWGEGDDERMFPTYYSAACGGESQSAAIFGPESDVPPLRGDVKCEYCKIAPSATYRWGPETIALSELRSRLSSRLPKLANIKRVQVAEKTSSGRAVIIQIDDAKGTSHLIKAEQFRHALGPSRIKSTDFKLMTKGNSVVFRNGRGFGHGLGLCQWGAQGQSIQGKSAADILRFYYPGSHLSRAY